MAILRNLLFRAARKIAADPRVRAKAEAVVEREVKPRARAAARLAKDNIDFARDELREVARETNPLEHPAAFLRKAKQRLLDPD